MEVKTQIFAVPTSAGTANFNISGWTETPVAAKFVLIGTDGTDSFDDDSLLGIGFTDGTNDYSVSAWSESTGSGSDAYRQGESTYCVANGSENSIGTPTVTAVFSQWSTGGVQLTWAGSGLSGNIYQVLVTFFAGSDVSAALVYASPGETVSSLSFTSKLILSATHCNTIDGGDGWCMWCQGVATNGSNGLTQSSVNTTWYDAAATTQGSCGLVTDHVAGQLDVTYDWQSAITSITSTGFVLDGSNSDDILFLCLTFDDDVDSGYVAVPTSGNIAVTDPGFVPGYAEIYYTTNTSINTGQDPADVVQGVGTYDGTRELSVSVTGEDAVTTANQTSVHSSEILHVEDADQNILFESSAIAFDAAGFDITMSTNPSTATYLIWWAVESGSTVSNITGTISASSTVSGDVVGRARISGGAGLGADLKDLEEINDDLNWTAYGTTTISQNGNYVNFIGGSDSRAAYVDLDAVVLTSTPTDGVKYSTRGVVWSESGAISVSLHGSVSGELDSVAVADGAIVRFVLIGVEETTGPNNIEFSGVAAAEEFNTIVYSVRAVQGTSVSGALTEKTNDAISGTITTSSTVSADVLGKTELSGTVNTTSTTSGDLVGKLYASGAISTSSTTSADVKGTSELSGSAAGSSTVSGAVVYPDIITQNGSWVNIIAGTKSTHARVTLDTVVLTADPTDDNKYQVRGVIWSESGAVTVALYNEDGLEDSEGITALDTEQFELTGFKTAAGDMYVTFTDFAAGEELNIYIYSVTPVQGSSVTADIDFLIGGDYVEGTITTSSTVSGALLGNTELSGAVATSSTLSASLTAVVPITGTISTSSSTFGDIIGTTELSGSIATSSTVSGTIQATMEISGTISTVSTVSGDVKGNTELSGTVSTASTVTADAIGYGSIAGTISTFSTLYGTLESGRIVGSISTSSTVSGDLKGTTELSVTISTSSAVAGDVKGSTELSGTINTFSTVSGYTTTPVAISGTITTSSTVLGDIRGEFWLTGRVYTYSTVTARHTSHARRSGSISTSSTVSGKVVGFAPQTASVSTSSTVSGDLIIGAEKGRVTGSITTSSTVSGDLILASEKKWITGSIATSSSTQADLSRLYITLSGTIPTGTTVAGDISYTAKLRGSTSTSSTLSANLISAGAWAGSIVTFSQVDGTIRAYNRRTVSIATSSTVSGDLVIGAQKGFITGSIPTASTVSADLVIGAQKGWMTSTVQTSSTSQADLSRRWISLSGSIPGYTPPEYLKDHNGEYILDHEGEKILLRAAYGTGSIVSASITFIQSLYGTITTSSTVSGAVATPTISGSISTHSTLSARLRIHGGSIQTGSTVAGFIKAYLSAAASVSTSSTVAGDLVIGAQRQWISGSISSGATVAGDLTIGARRRWISGSIASGATVSGDLTIFATMIRSTGTITTGTTVSADISQKLHISGTISTISAVSGSLKGVGSIESNVITASSVDGVVIGRGHRTGAITTSTTLAATMVGRTQLSGNVQTESIPDAHLSGRYELQGGILTYSQITADVKAWGVLGGVSLGYSEVEGLAREKGVPRDWWDIFVPSDDLQGIVVAEPSFKSQAGPEIHELACIEGEMGLWVYENDFGIPVLENTYIGIVDDDVAIGGIEGTGKGTWLEDHDGVDILDHNGAKIYI